MARGHFLCGVGVGIFDALFAFVVADLTRGTGVHCNHDAGDIAACAG
jgi:hypothetical protein